MDELLDGERRITPQTADQLCSYVHLDRELLGGDTPAGAVHLAVPNPQRRRARRGNSPCRRRAWVSGVHEPCGPGSSIELEQVIGERVLDREQ